MSEQGGDVKKVVIMLYVTSMLILSLTPPTLAWSRAQLYGGQVRSIVGCQRDAKVYAATYGGGVFGSTNNGQSWQEYNQGLEDYWLCALAVAEDGTLYAAGEEGLSVRGPASQNWVKRFHTALRTVAVNPTFPTEVWIGGWGCGLFKSSDCGLTFQNVRSGMNSWVVNAIHFDERNPTHIVVGTGDSGVYLSTDSGVSFTKSATGLQHLSITGLAASPQNPNWLYACANRQLHGISDSAGLYRSTNSGASWASFKDELHYYDVAVDANNPAIIMGATHYDGLLLTTDSGGTWRVPYPNRPDNRIYTVTQINGLTLMGSGAGISGSTDHGETWTQLNVGLTAVRCQEAEVDLYDTNRILVATLGGGMMRSGDAGRTWTFANDGIPLGTRDFLSVAMNPTNAAEVYAGADGKWLWKSVDNGQSWWSLGTAGWISASCIDVSYTSPNVVFAGTLLNGLYRSTDSGSTWARKDTGIQWPNYSSITIAPHTASQVIAGTLNGDHYMTNDLAETWTRIEYRNRPGGWRRTTLYDVAFTGDGTRLFMATSAGIYFLAPNWIDFVHAMPYRTECFRSIWVHLLDQQTVYAGGWDSGLYASTDGGYNFTKLEGGPQVPVVSISPVSLDPVRLLIATDGQGVFWYP